MQKYKILNKIFHITMGNKMGRGWRQNKKWGLVDVITGSLLACCRFWEKWYKWFLWLKVPPFIGKPEWACLSNGVGVSEIKNTRSFLQLQREMNRSGSDELLAWVLWTLDSSHLLSKSHVRNRIYWLRRLVEYVMKLIDFITKDIKIETRIEFWLMLIVWHYKTNV